MPNIVARLMTRTACFIMPGSSVSPNVSTSDGQSTDWQMPLTSQRYLMVANGGWKNTVRFRAAERNSAAGMTIFFG